MEVGRGKNVYQLKPGEAAIIEPNERHYFNNVSTDECVVTTTLDPGNKHFENALFILKGLVKDGLASGAGTPRKFSDLAIFIYLNNSKMVGFQKVAEPIFDFFAKYFIKKDI